MVYVMMMVRFPNDDDGACNGACNGALVMMMYVCKDDGDDALMMMMMMIFLLPELCPTGNLFPFPAR